MKQSQGDPVIDEIREVRYRHPAPTGTAAFVLAHDSMSSRQCGDGEIGCVIVGTIEVSCSLVQSSLPHTQGLNGH